MRIYSFCVSCTQYFCLVVKVHHVAVSMLPHTVLNLKKKKKQAKRKPPSEVTICNFFQNIRQNIKHTFTCITLGKIIRTANWSSISSKINTRCVKRTLSRCSFKLYLIAFNFKISHIRYKILGINALT